MYNSCSIKRQPEQLFCPKVKQCASSSNQEDDAHACTFWTVVGIFYFMMEQKVIFLPHHKIKNTTKPPQC
jgi:hypothetical protein